jgi:hypothetical protein
VSRKVSDLILANSSKCNKQLQNVTELKSLLEQSQNYCLNARYALNNTLNKFTLQSVGLVKNEYKKNQLCSLLKAMYTIKSLVRYSFIQVPYLKFKHFFLFLIAKN